MHFIKRLSQKFHERRRQATLAMVLTFLILGAIAFGFLTLAAYGFYLLKTSKADDAAAIVFLESERVGYVTEAYLAKVKAETIWTGTEKEEPSLLTAQVDDKITLKKGAWPSGLSFDDIGKDALKLTEELTVVAFGGKTYLMQALGKDGPKMRIAFRPIGLDGWLAAKIGLSQTGNLAYILNRDGQLIFTNDDSVTPATADSRPLVSAFVANPLKQGQVRLPGAKGGDIGYFAEIQRTNLVLFVETPDPFALAAKELTKRSLIALALMMLLVGLGIQKPLSMLVSPIKILAQRAVAVSQGDFSKMPAFLGFGELRLLSQTFSSMVERLRERDGTITTLLQEKERKARLESELVIAQSIQENLLPIAPLPQKSGLAMSSHYKASELCAGDWYTCHYDEKVGEAVVIIADVSGHGAGSSLFTALMAGLYEEFRGEAQRQTQSFPAETFLEHLDRIFHRIGRGGWHSSILIAKYQPQNRHLQLVNCGHPFPLRVARDAAGAISASPVRLVSDVIGLGAKLVVAKADLTLAPGEGLLFYTDGLTEGRDQQGRVFGTKRLVKAIARNSEVEPTLLVDGVISDWNTYRAGRKADDDVCLIALRSAV